MKSSFLSSQLFSKGFIRQRIAAVERQGPFYRENIERGNNLKTREIAFKWPCPVQRSILLPKADQPVATTKLTNRV